MKKINRKTFKIFLMILLPALLLWFGIVINNVTKEKEYTIERVISEATLQDTNTSLILERYMAEVIENLKVIRDADEFDTYFEEKSEENFQEVENLFIRIMTNKTDYDLLRYIDMDGSEIIRVYNDENIGIVSMEELENQSQAYYFIESMGLANDEIYISPLDLSIEDDEIEVPEKPVIRVATPIFDDNNHLQGIIVINYNAGYFLEILSKDLLNENISISEYYILNGKGEYILHPNGEDNFSFMYEDKKELTFIKENPEVWEQMIADNFIGSYITNNVVYSYYESSNKIREENTQYAEKWIVVHAMHTENLSSVNHIFRELLFTNNLIVFIVLVVMSFVVAYFIERIRRVDSELDITMKIANSTNDAVVIMDKDTTITFVNEAYENATGYTKHEVIGTKISDYKSGKHNEMFYDLMWKRINEKGSWEGKMWDRRKDGLLYPQKIKILSVKDKKNTFTHHYIATFSDMSGTKRRSDKFNSVYYREGKLTIPNKHLMIDLVAQSAKKEDANFMILYMAIENYNQLLSSFEEYAFDIPTIFADLIHPIIQKGDFIAQTESNLFVAIIDRNHIEVPTQIYVNNLRKEIGKVININGRDVFFKIRIGVSLWPEDTSNIERLLLNSMIALEWTSHIHESEIAFFNEKMMEEMIQENEIESCLGKAISNDELSLVYQPQIDISSGKIIGMEALLRWNSKELGNVSPAIFIPIAERNYLIIDIGTWVIENVCRDLEYLNTTHHFADKKIRCAINISAIQMGESGFVSKLLGIMDKYHVPRKQLEIEITENLLVVNDIKNMENLDTIRSNEISVAIDDFGTGYSSLSYLNTLRIDKIKIDRSFIKNFPENDDGKLAKILVEMSKTLDIKVLTEGAETEEQVEYLKGIGCNYIQGFYYSKPLVLDDFICFMDSLS